MLALFALRTLRTYGALLALLTLRTLRTYGALLALFALQRAKISPACTIIIGHKEIAAFNLKCRRFTVFTIDNGEGGGSAVGVGDGVGIYKTACAGLFDFCYCRSKLCIDRCICGDGGGEIKRGGEILVRKPAHEDVAVDDGYIPVDCSSLDNCLGFATKCAVVKCYVVGDRNDVTQKNVIVIQIIGSTHIPCYLADI